MSGVGGDRQHPTSKPAATWIDAERLHPVELLTVAEPEKLGIDGFSALFGTFNRRFLKEQEGLSLLVLESGDARADAAAFRAAGIGIGDQILLAGQPFTVRGSVTRDRVQR